MNYQDHLILYVDDEQTNRIVFQSSFAKRFQVKCVSTGLEALAVLAQTPVAVLVTDQRMPEMSGEELLTKVKEQYPSVSRIILTAYSDIDPILQAINRGLVMRYVVKPYERAQLDETLRWAIEAHVRGKEDSTLQMRILQLERLATLGSMAAAMLHDLRRPVSHFVTNTDRLKQLLSDKVARDAELPEIVEEFAASCDLMMGLMDQLGRFYRRHDDSGEREAEVVPSIQFAIGACREIAVLSRARIRYTGPPTLPTVAMPIVELSQVLLNVIGNAAQALRGHERSAPADVTIDAAESAAAVTITITDTGPGMSVETLAQAGTPFFSTKTDGTGLGIAQCRRLIGKNHGDFKISSELGHGTTIQISVPRAKGTPG